MARSSILEDLMRASALLPWRAGVALALGTGVLLHVVAAQTQLPTHPIAIDALGTAVSRSLIGGIANLLQYILPACLLVGAAVAFWRRDRARKLYDRVSVNGSSLENMHWRDFERLTAEYFRRRGYNARDNLFAGADGGTDVRLEKDGHHYLVQCKHWRQRQVGVKIVRELAGIIASQGASGGYVVTSGRFTSGARQFAQSMQIELIDGSHLHAQIQPRGDQPQPNPTVCPRCGSNMVIRVAKRGPNAGSQFLGCSTFPRCSSVAPLHNRRS